MNIILKSDHDLSDQHCQDCTGRTIADWFKVLDDKPELTGKRRETINWLYDEMKKDAWWPTTIWVEYQKSKGILLKDGRPDGYNICVTKSIAAPISTVFSSWKDKSLAQWFGDSAITDAEGNFRDSNGNSAKVTRMRPDKDLRYQWQTANSQEGSEVEVMFAAKDGKTAITLNHNRIQSRNEADGLRAAWGEALTRLKTHLESK